MSQEIWCLCFVLQKMQVSSSDIVGITETLLWTFSAPLPSAISGNKILKKQPESISQSMIFGFPRLTNLTHSYIAGGSRDLAITSRTVPNRSWFFCMYLDMVISNDIKIGLIRVHLKVYGHFYRKWRDFGTLNHVIVDHPISKPYLKTSSPFDPPWSVYPIYSQK